MKRLVILISGRGSNMQAIVEASIPNASISAVISNCPTAAGLNWATTRGIATAVVDHRLFASRDAFDKQLAQTIDHFGADVVILAGFMRILTAAFVHRYEGRIINIHPSLLPAFAGLHPQQRTLDAGCKITGCTVHFVTAALDHGPIIAQGIVPVAVDDTPQSLAQRILTVEHRLYPATVRWLVEERLAIVAGKVLLNNAERLDDIAFTVPAIR